jgi:hypothetical protein
MHDAGRRDISGRVQPRAHQPATEHRPIAPRRELRAQRLSDAHQLQSLGQSGQTDVVGGGSEHRATKPTLTRFDCLPPLLERRQVPAAAPQADDPETPFLGVECQAAANGE